MSKETDIFSSTNFKYFKGFDYQLKMSINYLSRYLKGYREIDFIDNKHEDLKKYIDSSKIFECHHFENKNQILLCKMYPMKLLLNNYSKEYISQIINPVFKKKTKSNHKII